MRIAIVHDYLAQAGGAERVVEAIHDLYPDAPIYTSIYDAAHTLPSFKAMDIRTSFLQRFAFARSAKFHKLALPLFPAAFEHFDMSNYDVVISNTTGFAKGVITGPETCHICYCHTPARFAWRYHEYVSQGGFGRTAKHILPFLIHRLRAWDYASAQRVDFFLSNSYNIARRVQKFYGKHSEVLHPPVTVNRFAILPKPSADYYLVVSRLVGYKRVDLAVEACTKLGVPLKVVGTGPDMARLKQMAGPTVELLGRLKDGDVAALFANCRAFLFPGEEDFGITPLEAMACGRPVVAYGAGGALETVVDGVTGVHFRQPTVDSLAEAIQRLERLELDPQAIRAHAEHFDVAEFQTALKEIVERCYALHKRTYSRISPDNGENVSHHSLIVSKESTILAYHENGNGSNGNGHGVSSTASAPPLLREKHFPHPS